MTKCVRYWIGWAVGGLAVEFPAAAGLRMGAASSNIRNVQWVVMERHWNFPEAVSDG